MSRDDHISHQMGKRNIIDPKVTFHGIYVLVPRRVRFKFVLYCMDSVVCQESQHLRHSKHIQTRDMNKLTG